MIILRIELQLQVSQIMQTINRGLSGRKSVCVFSTANFVQIRVLQLATTQNVIYCEPHNIHIISNSLYWHLVSKSATDIPGFSTGMGKNMRNGTNTLYFLTYPACCVCSFSTLLPNQPLKNNIHILCEAQIRTIYCPVQSSDPSITQPIHEFFVRSPMHYYMYSLYTLIKLRSIMKHLMLDDKTFLSTKVRSKVPKTTMAEYIKFFLWSQLGVGLAHLMYYH